MADQPAQPQMDEIQRQHVSFEEAENAMYNAVEGGQSLHAHYSGGGIHRPIRNPQQEATRVQREAAALLRDAAVDDTQGTALPPANTEEAAQTMVDAWTPEQRQAVNDAIIQAEARDTYGGFEDDAA